MLSPKDMSQHLAASQEALRAEVERRQAVWQAITNMCSQAIQAVLDWAKNCDIPKVSVHWWLQQEPTHVTIPIQYYALQLNLDGTLLLLPPPSVLPERPSHFPPSLETIRFQQEMRRCHREDAVYGGLPNLTQDDVMAFWGIACHRLSQDLASMLDDPECPH